MVSARTEVTMKSYFSTYTRTCSTGLPVLTIQRSDPNEVLQCRELVLQYSPNFSLHLLFLMWCLCRMKVSLLKLEVFHSQFVKPYLAFITTHTRSLWEDRVFSHARLSVHVGRESNVATTHDVLGQLHVIWDPHHIDLS